MYQLVHSLSCTIWYMQSQRATSPRRDEILEHCLAAYIRAGTLDVSLDELSRLVHVSKRMLIHYFFSRENIEQWAMILLEDRLRGQFSPQAFPPKVKAADVVSALWSRTVAPESRGVLTLVMDISRRAWNGSDRARSFYREQQRLWEELLGKYIRDRERVAEFLQLFQGAVLAYLVTGDAAAGRRSLIRAVKRAK